jgi:hypothetical protein
VEGLNDDVDIIACVGARQDEPAVEKGYSE